MNYEFIDEYSRKHGHGSRYLVEATTGNVFALLKIDEDSDILLSAMSDGKNADLAESENSVEIFFQKENILSVSLSLYNPTYREFARAIDMIISLYNNHNIS